MPHYVYILKCRDGTLYCGIAKDLKARLNAHNRGRGARYTRGRAPVKLVYSERKSSIGAALRREAEIKALGRKGKAALAAGVS